MRTSKTMQQIKAIAASVTAGTRVGPFTEHQSVKNCLNLPGQVFMQVRVSRYGLTKPRSMELKKEEARRLLRFGPLADYDCYIERDNRGNLQTRFLFKPQR